MIDLIVTVLLAAGLTALVLAHVAFVRCWEARASSSASSSAGRVFTTEGIESMDQETLTKDDFIWAYNEWWRRYRDEPEKFAREFQAIAELNDAAREGREPTLGDEGWAYVKQLLSERVPEQTKA